MPSILRSIVLSTLGTIFFVLALLWAIGDERFVPGLSNPHLLTSAGVLLLMNTGLFIIFKKEFLKKYFFPSLLYPPYGLPPLPGLMVTCTCRKTSISATITA